MLIEPKRKSSPRATLAPLALAVILALVLMPAPAMAYLDPGTGSFVIQGIIAAIVGGGFAVKMFWGRIKAKITGKTPTEDDDPDE